MRRAILNLLVAAFIIAGQSHVFFAQQTTSIIGDSHGRELVYPYSKLKEGQRGFYVCPRRTKLRGHIVPNGTKIVAEIARDHKGKLALFAGETIISRSGMIPKGTRILFR